MSAVIAVDFQRRIRAPLITCSTNAVILEAERDTDRQVRAICAARGVPSIEHDYIAGRAIDRLRSGESRAFVHAWARVFASDLVRLLRSRGPDDAA